MSILQNSLNVPLPTTNGQLLIGSTGSQPVSNTLTPGTGISITNAPGSITIASGASITWNAVITSLISLNPSNGYIINDGPVTFQTPIVAMPGDTYIIISAVVTGTFSIQTPISFPDRIYYNGALGTSLSTTSDSAAITIVCLLGPPGPLYFGVLSTNGATFTLT